MSAPTRARALAVGRAHWPFLVVFGAGVVLRLLAEVAYRPVLLYIDSYRYLDLVHTMDPTKSQTLGYVWFLWPLLKLGNLFVVGVVQHALGLACGAVIYLLARRYTDRRWLATLAAAPVLLDAYQVQIEHNVMSEPLFESLLVAAMAVLLWRARPGARAVAVGALLLGLAVPVRVVALPLIVPLVLFAVFTGGNGRQRVARGALAAVVFLAPVAAYASYYHRHAHQWALTTADARVIFGRAAQIVDCTTVDLPASLRPLCPPEPRHLRLGVDYYAHSYPVTSLVVIPQGSTSNDVVRDFAKRVFRQQPLDFVRAWAEDFVKGFRWDRVDARGDVVVSRWQFQEHWPFRGYGADAATADFGGGAPRVVPWAATVLRDYQLSIGYTPGPLLAVALLVGLAGGLGLGGARRSGRRAACWFATLSAAGVVLAADVYEFSWRYQLPLLVLAPIAGVVGASAVWPRRGRSGAGRAGTDDVEAVARDREALLA